MREIYLRQLEVARNLPSDAEALSYLTSILRSLLQSAALCAIEVVLKTTPIIDDDRGVKQYIDRFALPSDGLPIEIIDNLIPSIRSLVYGRYLIGWYEDVNGFEKTILASLTEWVEYRNKRPGHGVLDAPTTSLWARLTRELIERLLDEELEIIPRLDERKLSMYVGDQLIPITTPLINDGHAQVISKVVSRKGIWKIYGQFLSWTDAREFAADLNSEGIFFTKEYSVEKFKWSEVPLEKGTTIIFNNIPIRQTSNFVGRKKELDKLREWLKDFDDSRTCLVFGDGGFGKTTLVLEFFNNLIEGKIENSTVLPSVVSFYTAKKTKWTEEGLVKFKGISDAMEDSIRELMYCLTPVLGKEWYKVNGAALIDKVAAEFKKEKFSRDDILLIIDNTETLATSALDAEELADFMAIVAKKIGRVVITSRRRELLAAVPVAVSKLSEAEALQLIQKLGNEYAARSIIQAGEAKLRQTCQQLMYKPLLIDTLVRYIARSSSSIQDGLDQILKKTSDQLLEFLYEDAWERMNSLVREVFMVLVSLANPLDGKCVGDVCTAIGVQHAEFQTSLGETYFASIVDYGDSYDLEIVELAKKFFLQKKHRAIKEDLERYEKISIKVDKLATERRDIEKNYRSDRVADAFRSDYAKAAKIFTFKKDYESAKESFELALVEEPLNSALHDRYASFLLRIIGKPALALPYAQRASELDPNNSDAWLTLGLVHNKLGDLDVGDVALDKAVKCGKSESLCLLQKAIARYHKAKREPYGKSTVKILKEAQAYIEIAIRKLSPKEFYFNKNKSEAEKYKILIRSLISKINRREVISQNSPVIL